MTGDEPLAPALVAAWRQLSQRVRAQDREAIEEHLAGLAHVDTGGFALDDAAAAHVIAADLARNFLLGGEGARDTTARLRSEVESFDLPPELLPPAARDLLALDADWRPQRYGRPVPANTVIAQRVREACRLLAGEPLPDVFLADLQALVADLDVLHPGLLRVSDSEEGEACVWVWDLDVPGPGCRGVRPAPG